MNKNIVLFSLLLIVIVIPFTLHDSNDSFDALVLSDTTVGNYQSTTCKISLSEFYLKNRTKELNIYFNNNDYADVNCYGKITGVDKVGNSYFVSIGTNSSANIILQSIIWFIAFIAIPKSKKFTKFSIIPVLILPFILILQFVGEERFYRNNNILFDNVIDVNNYYFLLTFLNLLLICAVFNELLTYRFNEIINYIPFLFLITGTYTGSNLNIYFILGALLGLHQITISALNSEKIFSYADYIYFVFSIFWVKNIGF